MPEEGDNTHLSPVMAGLSKRAADLVEQWQRQEAPASYLSLLQDRAASLDALERSHGDFIDRAQAQRVEVALGDLSDVDPLAADQDPHLTSLLDRLAVLLSEIRAQLSIPRGIEMEEQRVTLLIDALVEAKEHAQITKEDYEWVIEFLVPKHDVGIANPIAFETHHKPYSTENYNNRLRRLVLVEWDSCRLRADGAVQQLLANMKRKPQFPKQ